MSLVRPPAWSTGLLLAATIGCGPSGPPTKWIPERTAMVQCTTAGRQRMPPTLLGLPVPTVPTGFYARDMDPLSLEDVGFQRDKVACAMLVAPSEAEIASASEGIRALDATYRGASAAAILQGGGCVCETARALGVADLIIVCADRETQVGCDPTAKADEVSAAVAPMQAQLAATRPAMLHWRLAGWTDRPGWFLEKADQLARRHTGGSVTYARGQAVPARGRFELIRALLDAEDVVAVVRQDSGRSILVVREIGSELVFDLFSHPVLDGQHRPLSEALANAHVDAYLDALARPEATGTPKLDAAKGNLVEVDRDGLDAVDRMLVAVSPFGGELYEAHREERVESDPLIAQVTFQAPFGHEGQHLDAVVELTGAGSEWAQTLTNDILSPELTELNVTGQQAAFTAADNPPPFVLRGTATNDVLFHGLYALPEFMSRVEVNHPSSVKGRADNWRFVMPASNLVEIVPSKKMERFRDLLAQRSYVIEAEFDSARQVLSLHMQPQ